MRIELHIDRLVIDQATGSSTQEVIDILTTDVRDSFTSHAARVRTQLDPTRAVTVDRLRARPGAGLGDTLTAPSLLTGRGQS